MRHFIKVGIDYQITPLEIREKFTFSDGVVKDAMLQLQKNEMISENIILSTCNRTEVYAVTENIDSGIVAIVNFLTEWFQVDEASLQPYLKILRDEETITYAFKLAAGLESMVLGETQILGQVRTAFLNAQQTKTTDKCFNELFKRVITFAKSSHHNTVIGKNAVSISYVAVELSKRILGNMKNKHAVILGAGKMAELAMKNLHAAGVSEITVVNRSLENAVQLVDNIGARAVSMNGLFDVLLEADILISSTGSEKVILTKEQVAPLQESRNNKALYLIDIAVPRDIAANVAEVENVFLYNMDDLQSVIDENRSLREDAATKIERQIAHELTAFYDWINTLEVVPIIKALREKSISIQEETLESIFRKIPDLDEREKKVLRKHTRSIVNQLLQEPIKHAKLLANEKDDVTNQSLDQFTTIFGLKNILAKSKANKVFNK